MGNNRLNWILLLMLIWARQSLQYECRQTEVCPCVPMLPDEYEMRCTTDLVNTFIIRGKFKDFASVKCASMSTWSDFELNSTAEVEDVHTFTFEQCELPDSSLHEITQRIGVQPTVELRFWSRMNLSSTLERSYFSGFPKLKVLDLSYNYLTNLPVDLLMDLPELDSLMLITNKVILPVQFFNSVPKLQVLELGDNNLTHIDPMLFRSLANLTYLALYRNGLTHIEKDTFENMSVLRTLDIGTNNLITLLPDVFKPLRNLSWLQISGNHFSSLPEGLLSNNLNLTRFQLHHNHGNMSTLPSRFFGNLPKLKEIYMNYDHLEVLPEDIFRGSPSITNITLTGNSFSTLPRNIFNETKNLQLLDLSSNVLTNLPDGIFEELSKLETLQLRDNNLTSISKELFRGLSGLKEINLEYNALRSISLFSFTYLQSLEVARLSHNQLTLLDNQISPVGFGSQSPFSRCEKLRELYLAHNNITEFFSDWNLLLRNLQKLDLKYNQISVVSAPDFQSASQNILIDITHNNISQIQLEDAEVIATSQGSPDSFNTRNVRILIEENPIICDCYLYDFLKYLNGDMHPDVQKMFHIIPGSLTCNGPEWMRQTRVSDLKPKTLLCAITECPEKCTCWFRKSDNTVVANCSYRNLSVAPERIESRTDGKVELDLTGNFFTEVPFINQSGNGNISKLLLSHNNISVISPENIPPTLEVLELHNNNLTRLDSMVLKRFTNTSLKNLTLHANPWTCDCEARDFLNFIQSNVKKIQKLSNVTCRGKTQPISIMVAGDLCPAATVMIIGISIGIAFLGLLIGILAAVYYRYQAEIKVWLYAHQMCLWFVTEEELDKDKLYDAFISFSHKDEEFVVTKLVPKLEEGPKAFKLCLHFRDWMAGEWIPTQIAKSVEDSRRTIVILSPNFLESVWGRMEFRAAHSQALSEGRARVIVILLGDVGPTDNLDPELKAYLSMNTYVEWGDPWFWDKLRYALPHAPKVRQNNAKKIYETHQHHLQMNGDKNGLIHPPGVPSTPPSATTPPADTLKTFTSNGSLNGGVLITDCLSNGTQDFNPSDIEIGHKPNNNESHNNMINAQSTPV